MGVVVAVVVVVVLGATWVTWTATRLDRLAVRVEAARSALDAQLVRRAAALQAVVDRSAGALTAAQASSLRTVARAALEAAGPVREAAENDVSRALRELPGGLDPALLVDLIDAARRVTFARRFHNDAVRDTVALRRRRLPRLLWLGGRRRLPVFFEIDDAVPANRPLAPPTRLLTAAGGPLVPPVAPLAALTGPPVPSGRPPATQPSAAQLSAAQPPATQPPAVVRQRA